MILVKFSRHLICYTRLKSGIYVYEILFRIYYTYSIIKNLIFRICVWLYLILIDIILGRM